MGSSRKSSETSFRFPLLWSRYVKTVESEASLSWSHVPACHGPACHGPMYQRVMDQFVILLCTSVSWTSLSWTSLLNKMRRALASHCHILVGIINCRHCNIFFLIWINIFYFLPFLITLTDINDSLSFDNFYTWKVCAHGKEDGFI